VVVGVGGGVRWNGTGRVVGGAASGGRTGGIVLWWVAFEFHGCGELGEGVKP